MSRKKWLWSGLIFAAAAGLWLGWTPLMHLLHRLQPVPGGSAANGRVVLYWVDPMHPQYKSDRPGKAPDCGMDLEPVYAEAPATGGSLAGTVSIPAAKRQLAGVRIGEVERKPVTKTVLATGMIVLDETGVSRIHSKIDGWIEKVHVDFDGSPVEKGRPLVDIYSPALLSTQQEFLLAARAKSMLADSAFPDIANGSAKLYEASRARLRLWDVDEATIDEIEASGSPRRAFTLHSPESGYVLRRSAYPGQRVTPETELYALADLSTVWVMAELYEYEADMVKVGQSARVFFPPSGRGVSARVDYVYPQLDQATRTVKVRIPLPNSDGALKTDMYARVEFQIDRGLQTVVPVEAVLDSGTEQIVFAVAKDGMYEPRRVRVGERVDDLLVVEDGLRPGERVVVSGNFLIDSESRLASALAGMNASGGAHEGHAPSATAAPPSTAVQPSGDGSQHHHHPR